MPGALFALKIPVWGPGAAVLGAAAVAVAMAAARCLALASPEGLWLRKGLGCVLVVAFAFGVAALYVSWTTCGAGTGAMFGAPVLSSPAWAGTVQEAAAATATASAAYTGRRHLPQAPIKRRPPTATASTLLGQRAAACAQVNACARGLVARFSGDLARGVPHRGGSSFSGVLSRPDMGLAEADRSNDLRVAVVGPCLVGSPPQLPPPGRPPDGRVGSVTRPEP